MAGVASSEHEEGDVDVPAGLDHEGSVVAEVDAGVGRAMEMPAQLVKVESSYRLAGG